MNHKVKIPTFGHKHNLLSRNQSKVRTVVYGGGRVYVPSFISSPITLPKPTSSMAGYFSPKSKCVFLVQRIFNWVTIPDKISLSQEVEDWYGEAVDSPLVFYHGYFVHCYQRGWFVWHQNSKALILLWVELVCGHWHSLGHPPTVHGRQRYGQDIAVNTVDVGHILVKAVNKWVG